MADQIVITEKSSQAKDVRAAVGSRYGDILPAEGHLLDLPEPEDVAPDWAARQRPGWPVQAASSRFDQPGMGLRRRFAILSLLAADEWCSLSSAHRVVLLSGHGQIE